MHTTVSAHQSLSIVIVFVMPCVPASLDHYFGWLANDDAQAYTLGKETWLPNPSKTAFRTTPHNYSYPSEIVFKENPGGEFRKSYHGYPSGFAQLLYSPTYGIIEPMQIDTHNRNFSITDTEGYTQDFLPRSQSNRSQTELDNQLSPLIECPCAPPATFLCAQVFRNYNLTMFRFCRFYPHSPPAGQHLCCFERGHVRLSHR